jgi:serine/threonine kinase 3
VYQAKHRETGFIVAMKVIQLNSEAREGIEKEINILKQCKSKYIVSYFGTCTKDQELWVPSSPFCGFFSLSSLYFPLSLFYLPLTDFYIRF